MKNRRRKPDKYQTALVLIWLAAVLVTALVIICENQRSKVRTLERFVPITRTICYGETAWEIADEYLPKGFDKREYIEICENVNGKDLSYVIPGEKIIFYAVR